MKGQTSKPILLFCLLLDLLAIFGSITLIILVVINLPSAEEFDNQLQLSQDVLVSLRNCMVVVLTLLVMYLVTSIINLSYSLSLLLPVWSLPRCLVYMKKVVYTEFIMSISHPKNVGDGTMNMSEMH